MDSNGVKRRDTTKGPPLRILSLDGGGVRGYSMFLIIQELMHRTFVEMTGRAPRPHELPKPCDHFDLIVGTGTGGLIALMLGRLRLDLEQCKRLYHRLTQMVFETDKTIAGIPYRSTLFKATKLEEAIKEAVSQHTVDEVEGNDGTPSHTSRPQSPVSRSSAHGLNPRRYPSNASVVSFSARSPSSQYARPYSSMGRGDPNARLYDNRENRTKTAVTAIYKGTPKGGAPALLRSYDSRKEPAPEFDCSIWQAGRATCAIGLAFKPIQIGHSVFHDDGAGEFNPSIRALDEAVVNEWPGREVGVFVSVGTGKRPKNSDANSTMWYEGFLGEFGEMRRKLIAKIEGCEKIHDKMKKEHLAKRGVNIETYYRFNVEVGVGEFGMNEWNRLAEIATNTRKYLTREDEHRMVDSAAAKLAKIHFAKLRWEKLSPGIPDLFQTLPETSQPLAVELPGDMPAFPPQGPRGMSPNRRSFDSGSDALAMATPGTSSPRSSADYQRNSVNGAKLNPAAGTQSMTPQPLQVPGRPKPQGLGVVSGRAEIGPDDADRLIVTAPSPMHYRTASGADKIAIVNPDDHPRWYQDAVGHRMSPISQPSPLSRVEPPPLPPKTPLPENAAVAGRHPAPVFSSLPYPVDDDAPPPVNLARKPNYGGR